MSKILSIRRIVILLCALLLGLFTFTSIAFAADTTPPTAPTSLTATAVASPNINLSWTAASDPESGIANYIVYRHIVAITAGNKGAAQVLTRSVPGATTTYTDSTGIPGETYYYAVSAVNGAGLEGSLSNSPSATVAGSQDPHYTYSTSTNLCRDCHEVHGALGTSKIYRRATQKEVCYTCHDGSGSTKNIRTGSPHGFGEATLNSTTRTSYHPVPVPSPNGNTVVCSDCHIAHKNPSSVKKLLGAGPTYISTGNEFCWVCHGTSSSYPFPYGDHQTDYVNIQHNTGIPNNSSGTQIKCINCHYPHAADVDPLVRLSEESLCFACHKSGGASPESGTAVTATNIKAIYDAKSYRHPTTSVSGKHKNVETSADFGTGNRHAECQDCHNSHRAKAGAHSLGTNTASNVLSGVIGAAVTNTAAWTAPTYSVANPISFEYELCFKCHSSYTTGYTGTDKALQFNTLNYSYHSIEGAGKNLGIRDQAFTLGTPWNPTSGDDSDYSASSLPMTCTDCHASNSDSDPRGPHGSTIAKILRRNASTSDNTLCYICHDQNTYTSSSSNSRVDHAHFYDKGGRCLECHDPHGINKYHLIKIDYTHASNGGTIKDFSMGSCYCHSSSKGYTNNY